MEQLREQAADFIESIVTGVTNLIQQPGKGFTFSEYVREEFKDNQLCKTLACMEGWLPVLRPDIARYIGTQRVASHMRQVFFPSHVDLPISDNLWQALTVPAHQHYIDRPLLTKDTSFEEVSALWLETAARIRSGELDELLMIEELV